MSRISKAIDSRSSEQKQADFLQYLEEYGNITRACKKAKISRQTPYNWIDDSEEFKAKFEKAIRIGVDGLEDEAKRRAFEGTLKPVFNQGKKVGSVREYSDTLLIVLLKGHKPEKYKERIQHGGDPASPIKHEHEVKVTRVIFEDMTEEPKE